MKLSEIVSNLYLSDRRSVLCSYCLSRHGLTSVLTIDIEPLVFQTCFLHRETLPSVTIKQEYVFALDVSSFNLLQHLQDTCEIINTWLDAKESIVVHCLEGQSRSVTVIAAYLMFTYNYDITKALEIIKDKKADIGPNEGFLKQLKLFEDMKYKFAATSCIYQTFLLTLQNQDLSGQSNIDHINDGVVQSSIKCKQCRILLVERCHLILPHNTQCFSIYLKTSPDWLIKHMKQTDSNNKILCHKCRGKLGAFNLKGTSCCGEWITPAIQLHKRRVDVLK